jgi:hypothetical protein
MANSALNLISTLYLRVLTPKQLKGRTSATLLLPSWISRFPSIEALSVLRDPLLRLGQEGGLPNRVVMKLWNIATSLPEPDLPQGVGLFGEVAMSGPCPSLFQIVSKSFATIASHHPALVAADGPITNLLLPAVFATTVAARMDKACDLLLPISDRSLKTRLNHFVDRCCAALSQPNGVGAALFMGKILDFVARIAPLGEEPHAFVFPETERTFSVHGLGSPFLATFPKTVTLGEIRARLAAQARKPVNAIRVLVNREILDPSTSARDIARMNVELSVEQITQPLESPDIGPVNPLKRYSASELCALLDSEIGEYIYPVALRVPTPVGFDTDCSRLSGPEHPFLFKYQLHYVAKRLAEPANAGLTEAVAVSCLSETFPRLDPEARALLVVMLADYAEDPDGLIAILTALCETPHQPYFTRTASRLWKAIGRLTDRLDAGQVAAIAFPPRRKIARIAVNSALIQSQPFEVILDAIRLVPDKVATLSLLSRIAIPAQHRRAVFDEVVPYLESMDETLLPGTLELLVHAQGAPCGEIVRPLLRRYRPGTDQPAEVCAALLIKLVKQVTADSDPSPLGTAFEYLIKSLSHWTQLETFKELTTAFAEPCRLGPMFDVIFRSLREAMLAVYECPSREVRRDLLDLITAVIRTADAEGRTLCMASALGELRGTMDALLTNWRTSFDVINLFSDFAMLDDDSACFLMDQGFPRFLQALVDEYIPRWLSPSDCVTVDMSPILRALHMQIGDPDVIFTRQSLPLFIGGPASSRAFLDLLLESDPDALANLPHFLDARRVAPTLPLIGELISSPKFAFPDSWLDHFHDQEQQHSLIRAIRAALRPGSNSNAFKNVYAFCLLSRFESVRVECTEMLDSFASRCGSFVDVYIPLLDEMPLVKHSRPAEPPEDALLLRILGTIRSMPSSARRSCLGQHHQTLENCLRVPLPSRYTAAFTDLASLCIIQRPDSDPLIGLIHTALLRLDQGHRDVAFSSFLSAVAAPPARSIDVILPDAPLRDYFIDAWLVDGAFPRSHDVVVAVLHDFAASQPAAERVVRSLVQRGRLINLNARLLVDAVSRFPEAALRASLPGPETREIFIEFCELIGFVADSDPFYERALVLFAILFGRMAAPLPELAPSARQYIRTFRDAANQPRLRAGVKQLCDQTRNLLSRLYPQL